MRTLLICLLLFIGSVSSGYAALLHSQGIPLLQNFKPKDYAAGTQNWALLQDSSGLIYVANNVGILEYDGVNWRTIQTANKSVARSLALAADERIYVGAKGEVGYLTAPQSGGRHYVSLTAELPESYRDFQDVRQTFVTPDGVFFISRQYVLQWHQQQFRIWTTDSAFLKAFWVQQRLLIRDQQQGLLQWQDQGFVPLPNGDFFRDKAVFFLEAFDEQQLLIGTRDHGFFHWHNGQVTPWITAVDQQLKQAEIYSGLTLQNGHFAIGTVHGGLFILDRQGRLVDRITKASGLHDQNVRAMAQDHQAGLWLALDHGLARIALGSALSVFNSARGLEGNVFAIHRHQQHLYAATSLGLFRLEQADNLDAYFRRVEPIRQQSWDFLSFEQQLLAATNSGVYRLQPTGPGLIRRSELASKVLVRSELVPERVYIGLQDGLATMRLVDGEWLDEGKVPGVHGNLNSIVEMPDGQLWLGTLAHGLYRLQLPAEWQGGSSVPLSLSHYDKSHGLPSLNRNSVHLLNNQLYFATVRGLFRFQANESQFRLDPTFGALFSGEQPWIRDPLMDAAGRLWMLIWDNTAGTRHAGVALPKADGSYQWTTSSLQPLADIPLDTILLDQQLVWFGGAEGIFRFVADQFQAPQPKPPLLRQLTSSDGQRLYDGGPVPAGLSLQPEQNNLRFSYSSPNFDHLQAEQLQVRLFGHDDSWSAWSLEPYRDYTNLPPGEYRFEIRARNAAGQISSADALHFRILAPWYQSRWLYAALALLFVLLMMLLMKWRTHSLLREQQRLAALVSQRTEHLQQTLSELETARQRAEAATQAKSQFLANISHELRTPLNAVLGFAELAQQSKALSDKQLYLGRIRNAGKILSSIINDLLDFSKAEAGKIQLEQLPFKLQDCIEQVVTLFSAQLADKKLPLQLNLAPDLPAQLVGDPLRLSQVLINLLSNAVKFTERGAIRLTISPLTTSDERLCLLFSLADTGIGISETQQQQLFQAFNQGDETISRQYGGTGLGLAICKRLVELMQGQIQLQSQPGVGTTVSFTAYFSKAKLPAANPHSSEAPSEPSLINAEPYTGKPLLVVDDNYYNQQLLKLMLDKLGYPCLLASNGEEALQLLAQQQVSLVLLDIEMPAMNGYQTLEAIRQLPGQQQLPVVAVTGHTAVQLGERQGQLQFDDMLTKPFSLASLQQQLAKFLR